MKKHLNEALQKLKCHKLAVSLRSVGWSRESSARENLTLMTRALLVPATTAKLGLCARLDDCGCTEVQGAVRGQASQRGGALTPRQPSRRVARADGDAHLTDDPPTELPGNSALPTLCRAADCAACR